MFTEKLQLKLSAIIQAIFDDAPFLVTVHALDDTSYKAYVTSSSPDMIGKLIGKEGKTANAFKELVHIIEKNNNIKLSLWFERNPTQ